MTVPAWQRPIFLGLGILFLVVGLVALVVPLIPGVVFLVLATTCFSRSSPRLERWLLTHQRLGPLVKNWRTSRALPRSAKWVITASTLASFTLIFYETDSRAVQAAVAVGVAVVLIYVWRRPEA